MERRLNWNRQVEDVPDPRRAEKSVSPGGWQYRGHSVRDVAQEGLEKDSRRQSHRDDGHEVSYT